MNRRFRHAPSMPRIFVALFLFASFLVLAAALPAGGASLGSAPLQAVTVVRAYPHDRTAYTQGLLYHGGFLYESTGGHGRSSLRKTELASGRVLRIHRLEERLFGEGLAHWKRRLIQLTWQSGVGIVYDRETFREVKRFSFDGEGWGLAVDQRRLIRSDGTAVLRFLDPETFRETGRVTVTDGKRPIPQLNELEAVRGEVFSHVWGTDRIARIDPATGVVRAWLDLSALVRSLDRTFPVDVANGIAWDARGNRLFVTGKLWPALFEIRVPPGP